MRILAKSSTDQNDQKGNLQIDGEQISSRIASFLGERRLSDKFRSDPTPHRIPPVPDLGITTDSLLSPILVGSQLYGLICIFAPSHELTDLDSVTIENAATVGALVMSRERAIHEAGQRLKDRLLYSLLDPDPYSILQDVEDTMHKSGITHGYQILALARASSDPISLADLSAFVEYKIHTQGLPAVVVEHEQKLVVLMGTLNAQRCAEVSRATIDEAGVRGYRLIAGLSTMSTEPSRVRQCYLEAIEALQIGLALDRKGRALWLFEELGVLHWLHSVPAKVRSDSRYYRIVEEIMAYEKKHGTELLPTLEMYLEHLGNAQQAAATLYLHRNTLNQRLARIEQVWNLNLRDPDVFLNLLFAIKSWRLNPRT
jgi:hypothetical protein